MSNKLLNVVNNFDWYITLDYKYEIIKDSGIKQKIKESLDKEMTAANENVSNGVLNRK